MERKTLDSGSSARKGVEVQVLSTAPPKYVENDTVALISFSSYNGCPLV